MDLHGMEVDVCCHDVGGQEVRVYIWMQDRVKEREVYLCTSVL